MTTRKKEQNLSPSDEPELQPQPGCGISDKEEIWKKNTRIQLESCPFVNKFSPNLNWSGNSDINKVGFLTDYITIPLDIDQIVTKMCLSRGMGPGVSDPTDRTVQEKVSLAPWWC